MKSLKRFIFFAAMILTFISAANAQTAIPEEKRKLIAEMITLTKVDKQMSGMMDMLLKSTEQSYSLIAKSSVDKRNDLTPAQKSAFEKEIVQKHNEMSARFRQRLQKELDYRQYIEQTMYPLYNKFFTENELKDLVGFYKTPTGQKLIETMPQLLAESIRLSQENLLPKITKIIDDFIREDIENLRQPTPKKAGR